MITYEQIASVNKQLKTTRLNMWRHKDEII